MSLGRSWRAQNPDAPHVLVFYMFVAVSSLAASAFFAAFAFVDDDVVPLAWRVAFQLPAVMFLAGVAQAVERVVSPERARQRAAGWTVKVRKRLIQARFIVLGMALGTTGVLSILRYFVSADARDVCDDLRVLSLALVFVFYALADLANQKAFDVSGLRVVPEMPVAANPRRRIRRSGLTVEDRRP